jgi:hypothetical protein
MTDINDKSRATTGAGKVDVTAADREAELAEAFGREFIAEQRKSYACRQFECSFPTNGNCECFNTTLARHRIATQAAQLDAMREALKGIANHPLANKPSDLAGWREFSKMLRRIARAALGETE